MVSMLLRPIDLRCFALTYILFVRFMHCPEMCSTIDGVISKWLDALVLARGVERVRGQ